MRICITGMGVVSALGIGQEENLQALREGYCGVGPIRHLKTEHKEFPVGEVPLSNQEMEEALGIPCGTPTTRSSLMGMMALDEALRQAGIAPSELGAIGLVSATTVGGMDKSEQYYLDFLANDSRNAYISTHDCGACSDMIADHFGRFASVTTLSTACSSAANAIILGAGMLRSGEAERIVVGGTECITKFHLNGFNTLMILDTDSCRPFSPDRAGLNLGEGAAYLVLETESSARKRNQRPLAYLSGYGNACDAFHQTASSPDGEGAYIAMKKALAMAGNPTVDYINAHGTGTPNNDESESRSIERLFGTQQPPLSSTKSMTGHTTSASGAIEAVFCILALEHQFIPAKRQPSSEPLLCHALTAPVIKPQRRLSHVLCNSFGFGGNDSSLLFSAATDAQPTIAEFPTISDRPVYLHAVNQISIQQPLSDEWFDNPQRYDTPYQRAIDPDFKRFISPIEARRMGRLLKRAIAVTQSTLDQVGDPLPQAIITGTGLGCVDSTEQFLTALCNEGEQLLKPTHFMQSTHNTIGSTLAIRAHNHAYNATYAQKSVSFESALYDGFGQIASGQIDSVLVGAHDELTPTYFELLKKARFVGQGGETASEVAVAAYLSHQQEGGICQIADVQLFYRPTTEQLQQYLETVNLDREHLAVMTSLNGNTAHDTPLSEECKRLFGTLPLLRYKHLFGESYSASALGFYVAATCLQRGRIPDSLYCAGASRIEKPHSIILFNRNDELDCSIVVLKN